MEADRREKMRGCPWVSCFLGKDLTRRGRVFFRENLNLGGDD